MSNQEKIAIDLGLHDLPGLRWPKEPLCGDGPRQDVTVPLPRLPWSNAEITVPLGADAARGIARVLTLRKIIGYGVAPAAIALFVLADILLIAGRYGALHVPGRLFLVFGVLGFLLVLSALLPDRVARATGTPYVSRNRLRLPAARTEVVRQLVKLNPRVEIGGISDGDLPSPK